MTRDKSRGVSYAEVFHIGTADVSVDYYSGAPAPGPHWIFTVKRAGGVRTYKYTLRPEHAEERGTCTSGAMIAGFLLRHLRSAEPVQVIKREEDDESEGPADKG